MNRAVPYLHKKSASYDAMRESLAATTLYLVNRTGPTVFSVRDEHANTFKVILGNPHVCSCEGGRSGDSDELCVHKMYCMIKVLRISESHPLVYQLGFTDGELDQILSGMCSDTAARGNGGDSPVQNRSAAARARRKALLDKSQGNNASNTEHGQGDGFVDRQVLGEGEDDICPICQDQMGKDQALTWCRKGCGNNIHAKCMQTFAQYKIVNRQPVGCPLCREDWMIEHLKQDARGKASLKNSCAPVFCHSCTMPVRSGPFHRCVECSQKRMVTYVREEREKELILLQQEVGVGGQQQAQGTSWLQIGSNRAHTPILGSTSGGNGTTNGINGATGPGGVLTDIRQFAQRNEELASANAAAAGKPPGSASSAAARRCVDFCERCLPSLSREHSQHHFVQADAGVLLDDDVEWSVSVNPFHGRSGMNTSHSSRQRLYRSMSNRPTSEDRRSSSSSRGGSAMTDRGDSAVGGEQGLLGLGSENDNDNDNDNSESLALADNQPSRDTRADLVRELEGRELTMDDYELLLQLDEANTTNISTAKHLANALPKWQATRMHDNNTPLCWCRVTAETAASMDIANLGSLRTLPCSHVVHDACLILSLEKALQEEAIPHSKCKCRHEQCGRTIFLGLNRRRKKSQKDKKKKADKEYEGGQSQSVMGVVGVGGGTVPYTIAPVPGPYVLGTLARDMDGGLFLGGSGLSQAMATGGMSIGSLSQNQQSNSNSNSSAGGVAGVSVNMTQRERDTHAHAASLSASQRRAGRGAGTQEGESGSMSASASAGGVLSFDGGISGKGVTSRAQGGARKGAIVRGNVVRQRQQQEKEVLVSEGGREGREINLINQRVLEVRERRGGSGSGSSSGSGIGSTEKIEFPPLAITDSSPNTAGNTNPNTANSNSNKNSRNRGGIVLDRGEREREREKEKRRGQRTPEGQGLDQGGLLDVLDGQAPPITSASTTTRSMTSTPVVGNGNGGIAVRGDRRRPNPSTVKGKLAKSSLSKRDPLESMRNALKAQHIKEAREGKDGTSSSIIGGGGGVLVGAGGEVSMEGAIVNTRMNLISPITSSAADDSSSARGANARGTNTRRPLPQLNARRMQYKSQAPLSHHLQPSGMSRGTAADTDANSTIMLSIGVDGAGLGVQAGLGWTMGDLGDEEEEEQDNHLDAYFDTM